MNTTTPAARLATLYRALPATVLTALLAACGGGSTSVVPVTTGITGTVTTTTSTTGTTSTTTTTTTTTGTGDPKLAAWLNFGGNAQHTALGGATAAQNLTRLVWRADVDLAPTYNQDVLTSGHYGPPIITAANTVILPVRVTAAGAYRIEARSGVDGTPKWQSTTDFIPVNKTYSYGIAATPQGRVYFPGAGGKLHYRDNIDGTPGPLQTVVYYGASVYESNKAALDTAVIINTPLTTDADGNVFFGVAAAANPANLTSAIVRVAPDGKAVFTSVSTAAGDVNVSRPANSAAPALSPDSKTVYAVATSAPGLTPQTSFMLAFDSTTMAVKAKVALVDPKSGQPANVSAGTSASPAVGPDGDVYYGVLARGSLHQSSQGWLLHFDATLATTKTPGAFGWDFTPSIVPASIVSSYKGSSKYLLLTKYNEYQLGRHRMAILDPNATQDDLKEPTVKVMQEVITLLGQTNDPSGGANFLHEWCVNTAAVDPITKSVFINSSDGILYRWNLNTNQVDQSFNLNVGYYQSYTPTMLGPDGKIYAINNAVLMAIGN
ncbi:MAG TPA: hypothetical protein VIT92_13775 [Burkholderiaceae bacterium]